MSKFDEGKIIDGAARAAGSVWNYTQQLTGKSSPNFAVRHAASLAPAATAAIAAGAAAAAPVVVPVAAAALGVGLAYNLAKAFSSKEKK